MELKQLQYFVAVAKEGNISKAAKKLHISQPPLSIQLKHLEDELGCMLFERGAREIELTEAGLLLYNRALSLLELSSITAQEISDLKNQTAGTLRLGAVSSVGSTVLNKWIVDLHKKYPDIHYEIFEGNTYEQIEQLKNHTIDIALVRSPFPTADMHVIPLRTEPMMAVGNRRFFSDLNQDHAALAPGFSDGAPLSADEIPLSALAGKPLIIYRRWEDTILSAFLKHQLSCEIFCKNEDARTTLHWADAGLGIGIIPGSAVSLIRQPDTICKKIADADLISSICLVYHENHYLSALAKLFLNYLTTHHCEN